MNFIEDVMFGPGKSASIVKNPFNKSSIEGLSMHISKSVFNDKFRCWGIVKFKNGDTSAEQRFQAETFDLLYYKISKFVETL